MRTDTAVTWWDPLSEEESGQWGGGSCRLRPPVLPGQPSSTSARKWFRGQARGGPGVGRGLGKERPLGVSGAGSGLPAPLPFLSFPLSP